MTVLVLLLWSLFLGGYQYELQFNAAGDVYWRSLNYIFDGSISLFIPVLLALALRAAGLQSRSWYGKKAHWTMRLPQMVLVFLVSWGGGVAFSNWDCWS
ncbi:hypothetical protein DTW90_17215 [Neorhizobium sp. P12A]|uniref:hypothetical protein n=1 Tax=Neorhizobium sp. P12A TaxID=2268027 RepID=UPI0011ED5AFF|nr:hypothetical protein [Neorhizobium sp. P12A]KAA0697882.1 hypothetical protein DTW90_17215 [Neorhizobium sp. P12A]